MFDPITGVHTVCNFHHRFVVEAHETTAAEREDLDYVDWEACEAGQDSFTGVRYRGWLYDLGEFERATGTLAAQWDGWQTSSAFDAVAIRYVDAGDGDPYGSVVVAHLHW